MKIKEGYMLREVAEEAVVVPIGSAALNFEGIISLNETGAFLWKQLEHTCDQEQLKKALLEKYNVDEKTAQQDIEAFIIKARQSNLIEE
ncbi:MAG: PqqD family protein [Eubacterium sp.]